MRLSRRNEPTSAPSAAPPPTPITILGPKLLVWLRSDLGISGPGGSPPTNVSGWADQSGNGNHATQPAAALQPAYAAFGGINGRAKISYAGGQVLSCAGLTLDNFVYILILRLSGLGMMVERSVNAGANTGEYLYDTGDTCLVHRGGLGRAGSIASGWESDGIAHLVQFTYDDAVGGGLFLDGTQLVTLAPGLPSDAQSQPLFIGARSGPGLGVTGEIDEVIVCSAALSGAETTAITNYINALYGIT